MCPPPLPCFIPVFQEEIAFIPKWENIKLKKWKPCTSSVLCRDWLGIWYMFDQCCSLRLEVHNREWMYRTFGTGCWGAGKFLACVRAERRKRDPGRFVGSFCSAKMLSRCLWNGFKRENEKQFSFNVWLTRICVQGNFLLGSAVRALNRQWNLWQLNSGRESNTENSCHGKLL